MLDDRPYTFDRVFRLAVAAALIWGLVYVIGYLSDVLIPFAVALLLAYLINPLVLLVHRKVKGQVPAVLLSLLLAVAAAATLVAIVVPLVLGEIGHMGRVLSDVVNNSKVAERAAESLPPDLWGYLKDFLARDEVREFFRADSFWKIAEAVARKVLPGVWGLITGTTSFLMGLVGLAVIGLYLVFLLIDYRKVKEGWKDLLPPAHRESILSFVADFDRAMNRYFRAQALVAAIVGVLMAVGFTLIGLPLGILLGLFVGVLNMVPYLQLISVPPALLLGLIHALEVGGNVWLHLGLVILVFVVVQAIQDGLLVPRIMGDVTGLSPAVILLSLSIWGKLLGMFGLLIALPLTCLVWAYYQRFLARLPGAAPAVIEPADPPAPPADGE
ncbi:MAG: AI-2E family transporter [Thermodesulfobacteriota bacterium]